MSCPIDKSKGDRAVRKFTGSATLLAAAMGLGTAMPAQALGLGSLEVDSALFRPVQARIPLLGLGITGTQDVRVTLASPEEFLGLGVDRPHSLRQLRFEVDRHDGEAYIRVSTRAPQREPMMQFLVSVEWPGGRLLREYTALFDPPGWEAELAAPDAGTVEAPTAAFPDSRAAAVRDGETLWRIASRHAGADADINQVMVALLRANRQAFADGNINQLQRGARLEIPARERMAAIDVAEAAALVRGQLGHQRLSPRQAPATVQIVAQARSAPTSAAREADTASVAPSGESAPAAPRISLSAPGSADAAVAGAQSALSGAALQRQVVDLRRIVSLKEEQLGQLERVLARRDAEVATLRHLVELSEAEAPSQTRAPEASTPAAAPPAIATLVPLAVSAPDAAAAPVAAVAPVALAASPTVATHPSRAPWLEDLVAWLLGGLVALLGLSALFGLRAYLRRDRRPPDTAAEVELPARPSTLSPSIHSQLQDTLGHLQVEDAAAADRPVSDAGRAEGEPEPAAVATGDMVDEPAAASLSTSPVTAAAVGAAGLPPQAGPGEAAPEAPKSAQRLLEEIDVYLAYGLPDQALVLVQQGLAQAPDSAELLVRQLDVLMADDKLDEFKRCAHETVSRLDPVLLDGLRARARAAGIDVATIDDALLKDPDIAALDEDGTLDLSGDDELSLLLDESLEFGGDDEDLLLQDVPAPQALPEQRRRYG